MTTNPNVQIVSETTASFVRLFGRPIDLWIFHGNHWQHAVDPLRLNGDLSQLEDALILPESLPQAPETIQEPIVNEIATGLFLIGAPLVVLPDSSASIGGLALAWGTVRTSTQAVVATLLRVAQDRNQLEREASELRMGMNPHLEQISSNFEELTYFRRLGEQIDLRDVTDPLADLADRILTELGPLIKAAGLGFVAAAGTDQRLESGPLRAGQPVAWYGRRLLDPARCGQLIDVINHGSRSEQSIVQNQMQALERFHSFPEIHSCIQVPVVHRGAHFGWLLALNRIPWEQRSTLPAEMVPIGTSDNEFGTVEAGLMGSAASTLAAHYRNSELFREKELLLIGVVRALINAIDAKDSYTCGHSDRVAVFAKCIGEQMGLASRECEHLYMSGLLHDLGKIGIPDHVLCKPGKLTDEEFAIIRQHPTIGHSILNHLPQLQHILPGVLHHHESVNGKGYPLGLSETEIPLFARILAVADSYDAMTSARPYRSAMSTTKAVGILLDGAGTQWDKDVVEAFLKARPQIETACEHSQAHLQTVLRTTADAGATSADSEADTIARAVTAMQA